MTDWMEFESGGEREAKEAFKSFLEKALNIEDIDSAVIIASSKGQVKKVCFGDSMKVYGLLDFMKRHQWMMMAYPSEKE